MQGDKKPGADTRSLEDRQSERALLHLLATLADIAANIETQHHASSQRVGQPKADRNGEAVRADSRKK